jgi:hypothetical protein
MHLFIVILNLAQSAYMKLSLGETKGFFSEFNFLSAVHHVLGSKMLDVEVH